MIWYINPSKPRKKARRKSKAGKVRGIAAYSAYKAAVKRAVRAGKPGFRTGTFGAQRKPKRKKNPSKKSKLHAPDKVATKRLHGAALAARQSRLAREAAERSKKMAKKRRKKGGAKWVVKPRKARRRRKLKLGLYATAKKRRRKGRKRSVAAYLKTVSRRHKRRASRKGAPRKSSKRSRAAKKAARTRAAKKAARRAAAKKGARKRRRGGGRKTVSRRRRKGAARRRTRRSPRRHRRVVALKRAVGIVRSYRRSRRKSRAAKAYARRHRLGAVRIRNPFKAVLAAVKQAAPFGVGYVAGHLVGTKGLQFLASKVSAVGALGQHAPVVGSLAAVAALAFATGRGPLARMRLVKKYRSALLAGAGLNAIFTAVKTYNPGGVLGYLGMGDYASYAPYTPQGAFPVGTGDYVQVGDYVETGDYIQTGAYEDAAAYEEVGALTGGFRPDRVKMLAPVPNVSSRNAIPGYPSVMNAPGWSDDEDALFTGIFAGGGGY